MSIISDPITFDITVPITVPATSISSVGTTEFYNHTNILYNNINMLYHGYTLNFEETLGVHGVKLSKTDSLILRWLCAENDIYPHNIVGFIFKLIGEGKFILSDKLIGSFNKQTVDLYNMYEILT